MARNRVIAASIVLAVGWIAVGMEYHAALRREQSRCLAAVFTKMPERVGGLEAALDGCYGSLDKRIWGPLEYMLAWPGIVAHRLF
jgi:hypothetical protein